MEQSHNRIDQLDREQLIRYGHVKQVAHRDGEQLDIVPLLVVIRIVD